jgi:hypothetical protein
VRPSVQTVVLKKNDDSTNSIYLRAIKIRKIEVGEKWTLAC